MTGLLQDLRYAVRLLRQSPGFAAVAVITLALAIGANTGIFTLVNAVLLKSLPVPHPEQLFFIEQNNEKGEDFRVSYPLFERLRSVMPASAKLAAMSWPGDFYASSGNDQPELVTGQLVSGEFFPTFETYPALGRLLTPEDNRVMGGHPVAVISHRYWERHFHRAPDVIGQKLTVNRMPFTIIGVAAPEFFGATPGKDPAFWIPAMMQYDVRYSQHYSASDSQTSAPWIPQKHISWLRVMVRAASPAIAAQVTAVLNVFNRDADQAAERITDPQARADYLRRRVVLVPGSRGLAVLRQQFSRPLLVLMGMVGLVLLIACASVANLLLARSAAREREIAIRLAVGAPRSRLIRQLLSESLLLSFAGTALGIGIAYWCSSVLPQWANLGSLNLAPDITLLLFSCGIAVFTAVLFGLAPARRGSQVEPISALKVNARTSAAGHRTAGSPWSFKQTLVAAQVALSLLLLVGAGLFLRTLRNFSQLDAGFDRNHLLTVWTDTEQLTDKPEQLATLYDQLIERVDAIPGVRSASLSACGLASGCHSSIDIYLSGNASSVLTQVADVSLHYFDTVGIPLLRGRDFNSTDNESSPKVAIVNQTFVRRFLPGVDPIGQRFGDSPTDRQFEIVGVVADARVNDIREPAPPMAYATLAQFMGGVESIDIRTAADPQWLIDQVRQALKEVEPSLPIAQIVTLSDQVNGNLSQQRLIARLTAMFGVLALGLACLGLYGVMSYSVARRTSELGIRLALGSTRAGVLWLVLRATLFVAGIGIAAGAILSLLAARVATSLLFGISPNDPATLIAAAVILLASALLAAYIPARRAAKVNPMEALRYE